MNITITPSQEAVLRLWIEARFPAAKEMISGLEFEVGTHIVINDRIDANTTARVVIDVVADPKTT